MSEGGLDWEAVLASARFRRLIQLRRNTIIVLTVMAAIYYFSIPALMAWAPDVLKIRLAQGVNLGTVFVVSQYPFGGLIVYMFMRRTAAIDRALALVTLDADVKPVGEAKHHAY